MVDAQAYSNGKIILFGEHAVVYGVEAIAGGIANAVEARVSACDQGQRLHIPAWGVEFDLLQKGSEWPLLNDCLACVLSGLSLDSPSFELTIHTELRPASGLGASAAFAVAATRALAKAYGVSINDEQVNAIAFDCEKLAHGKPSGLDNTLATFGGVCSYKRIDGSVKLQALALKQPLTLLIAMSGKKGFTAETVARVRGDYNRDQARVSALFERIAHISALGKTAIERASFDELAELFNENQACLRDLGVSCAEIERVLELAISAGASGGKLTGSGDGGAVILMTGARDTEVKAALDHAHIDWFEVTLMASSANS